MSDQRRGSLPGTVKITHIHTTLVQPTLLPSVIQKTLITIKHAFWSRKASFWIMAGACANMAHLCHFPLLTVLFPLPKERQTTFPKVSNSLGHLETQSCRMKLNQLGHTTHGDPTLVPLCAPVITALAVPKYLNPWNGSQGLLSCCVSIRKGWVRSR